MLIGTSTECIVKLYFQVGFPFHQLNIDIKSKLTQYTPFSCIEINSDASVFLFVYNDARKSFLVQPCCITFAIIEIKTSYLIYINIHEIVIKINEIMFFNF